MKWQYKTLREALTSSSHGNVTVLQRGLFVVFMLTLHIRIYAEDQPPDRNRRIRFEAASSKYIVACRQTRSSVKY